MLRMGALALLISISGAACATTSAIPASGARGDLRLDVRSPDDAHKVFPARVGEARLDRVDRFAHRVWAEHAGAVSTEVRLCINPDGTTESVNLLQTSGMLDYDIEVVEGAAKWHYQPFNAPEGTRVCRAATVTYQAK